MDNFETTFRKIIKQELAILIEQEVENSILGIEDPRRISNEKLYTQKEAKQILRRSDTTMWRLRKNGLLTYHKYGNKILYKKSDLDNFINENYTG